MARGKRSFRGFIAVLLCLTAVSCYSPDEFEGEVVIDHEGNLIMTYVGDLIWVPLYRDIKMGKITDEARKEESINNIRNDLGRDSGFREITSKDNGRFFVKFKRTGRITGTGQITFVRRDSTLMTVRTTPDEITTFSGVFLTEAKRNQMKEMGLGIRGAFRLITDAEVINNNAQYVYENDKGPGMVYEWRINSFDDPMPRLSLRIKFKDFQIPSRARL